MTQIDRRTVLAALAVLAAAGMARADDGGVPPADRELRVAVPGGRIYVRVNGDLSAKRAPLLLVHGGPGGAAWQLFPALALAAERAVILYDQLDSGRSDAPGDPVNWTVDRFVAEIEAIRAELRLSRLHLLGHSWGGIVANRYAARRPRGLLSLTLQGAPLSAQIFKDSIASLVAALPEDARAAIETGERTGAVDTPAFQDAFMMLMRKHIMRTSTRKVGMPYMADLPEDRGEAVGDAIAGSRLTAGFTGALAGFDDTALAKRVRAPTLLLCGDLDIITPAATRAMLPLFRRGAFQEIANAGHMAQFDQPEAWRAAVSGFIAAHDR